MFNNHNGWGNFLHQPQPQNQEPLLSDFAAVVTPSTEKRVPNTQNTERSAMVQ